MSHEPLFGSPAANCAVRLATERCWNAALPKVIGVASLAVGLADDASGVKSEKRTLAAPAIPLDARTPASARALATNRRFEVTFMRTPVRWGNPRRT
jgi:hypothetical protein